jgi:hypothetical protein
MKRALIIAAVLAAATALSACGDPTLPGRIHRSQGVLTCGDGTIVGRDPQTGQYVFIQNHHGYVIGDIAAGVTPHQFCAGTAQFT